jgi:hypothetical protein
MKFRYSMIASWNLFSAKYFSPRPQCLSFFAYCVHPARIETHPQMNRTKAKRKNFPDLRLMDTLFFLFFSARGATDSGHRGRKYQMKSTERIVGVVREPPTRMLPREILFSREESRRTSGFLLANFIPQPWKNGKRTFERALPPSTAGRPESLRREITDLQGGSTGYSAPAPMRGRTFSTRK